ncbi:alpha/beta fold hydrolase [Streptomyces sp. G5(2025)]|uniref:alpha/beta fold hydrolase n=1 Tax=Streptomyces sp. G5(2025) TaxID=3406628 RepID=UPI003C150785
MSLFAPVVQPHRQRAQAPRQVLARDDALLASLDPADHAVFTGIAAWQNPQGWAAFWDHVLPGFRAHHRADAQELAKAFTPSTTPETRFATHEGPHLLVTGRQDHMVGRRDQLALPEHYPNMTYAALHGAGHNVHLDRPGPVGALFGTWLDEVAGRR